MNDKLIPIVSDVPQPYLHLFIFCDDGIYPVDATIIPRIGEHIRLSTKNTLISGQVENIIHIMNENWSPVVAIVLASPISKITLTTQYVLSCFQEVEMVKKKVKKVKGRKHERMPKV